MDISDKIKNKIINSVDYKNLIAFILCEGLFVLLFMISSIDQASFVKLSGWGMMGLFGSEGLDKLTNIRK